jgi:putative DNA primase/helicase
MPSAYAERNRHGSYFVGLKIRTEDDDKPPMITGERKCQNIQAPNQSNPNIINRVWTMVMDKVTTAIERIIDDGLGSESETEVETETQQEQSRSPERESNVETQSSNEICVGERVIISDYPGHWSWVSPYCSSNRRRECQIRNDR